MCPYNPVKSKNVPLYPCEKFHCAHLVLLTELKHLLLSTFVILFKNLKT